MTLAEGIAGLALLLSVLNTVALVLMLRGGVDVATATKHGLPLGAALPAFAAVARGGRSLTDADARGSLVLFLGAGCNHCFEVARELQTRESAELANLLVAVIDATPPGRPDLFPLLDFVSADRIFADPERAIADRLAVPGSPFAYAIDRDGRVRAKQAAIDAATLLRLQRFTR